MGKTNNALNAYMNRREILADFCNGSLYKGRQFLSPLQFAEVQRFYHEDIRNRALKKQRIHRKRDVATALYLHGHFIIFGVEN